MRARLLQELGFHCVVMRLLGGDFATRDLFLQMRLLTLLPFPFFLFSFVTSSFPPSFMTPCKACWHAKTDTILLRQLPRREADINRTVFARCSALGGNSSPSVIAVPGTAMLGTTAVVSPPDVSLFEADGQLEAMFSGLRVIDIQGCYVRLSLKTYIPNIDTILLRHKVDFVEPPMSEHEMLVEFSERNMDIKSIEVVVAATLSTFGVRGDIAPNSVVALCFVASLVGIH
ncbi:hypothetical protein ZIOFF_015438 [Zingiber officinale]|uniref:Uncharacterized protein n=1 Tax=Zingiber officinale TaxID=94328 RepID=A0A8J5LMF5_ZINOF|nr:hypothetical protein ZIOFF_015438 [Zingiber officinale]